MEYNDINANEIEELLSSKQYLKLVSLFRDMNAADIAQILDGLENEDSLKLFRLMPKDIAADVFSFLELDDQQYIINSLSDKEATSIIDNLMSDDATDLLEEMPANMVKKLLLNARSDTRTDINHLLRYPEGSAGSLMTVEYVDLKSSMTVQQALDRIRQIALDKETVNVCYVTDEKKKLLGTVALRLLIMHDPEDKIGDIMNEHVISVNTMDDQEETARAMQKYDFTAMPVVDNEGRIVGIVTIDDVVDIIEEEATEDIEKMAAILPGDKTYFKTTVWETYKARMPWLLLLMISATFTGAIIRNFEDALASYVVLTAYIPMLMDTGGNAGSQSSVSIIRGLSLHEIEFRDLFKALWKEIRVAVCCGITLAGANFIKLILIDRVSMPVSAVICLTLVVVVFFAKLIGCLLPMVAEKVGLDPAVMASPMITTIVDAVSLFTYFSIATQLLHLAV